jgi:hypothetical protein
MGHQSRAKSNQAVRNSKALAPPAVPLTAAINELPSLLSRAHRSHGRWPLVKFKQETGKTGDADFIWSSQTTPFCIHREELARKLRHTASRRAGRPQSQYS